MLRCTFARLGFPSGGKVANPIVTHEVVNQAPFFENYNAYESVPRLVECVKTYGAAEKYDARLRAFGEQCGSAYWLNQAMIANKFEPVFTPFDKQGRRIDQATLDESYHRLMELGLKSGLTGLPSEDKAAGHVASCAHFYVFNGLEQGTSCPLTMTAACIPAMELGGAYCEPWIEKMRKADYDDRDIHISLKRSATCGMSMTEKQGGSDVRQNTTFAVPVEESGSEAAGAAYKLVGHKWFTSAPMSDSFLTLAYTPDNKVSCFLVPRWISPTQRNVGLRFQRLKSKMGDKSNASSEVEYNDAIGYLVGKRGEGVKTIIKMVNHTRLLCTVGTASLMNMAVMNAIHHCTYRSAFGGPLVSKPLMQNVLCDLALEVEGATALAMRVAKSFDEDNKDLSPDYMRLAVAIGKYTVCKRGPSVVAEAMECMGGNGYLEDFPVARLFRQSPLNSIWEGSGNVIVLDVFRAVAKNPSSLGAVVKDIKTTNDPVLIKEVDQIVSQMRSTSVSDLELSGRRIVERLGVLLEAAALFHSKGDMSVYEKFVATRIGEYHCNRGVQFGTLEAKYVDPAIIARNTPKLNTTSK